MLFQDLRATLGKFTVPIPRIFQYNVSNWIREMPGLLFFTDGLTIRFPETNVEDRLRNALADASGSTMHILKSSIHNSNDDDVTILLVKRADAGSLGRLG